MREIEIPGCPGYVAREDGAIRGPRRWLKPVLHKGGYYKFTYRGSNVRWHVAICLTFHGPKPGPEYQVLHRENDKSNNAASNLRWGTRAENIADMHADGCFDTPAFRASYERNFGL